MLTHHQCLHRAISGSFFHIGSMTEPGSPSSDSESTSPLINSPMSTSEGACDEEDDNPSDLAPNVELSPVQYAHLSPGSNKKVQTAIPYFEVWDEQEGVTLTVSFKELSNRVHQAAEFLQQAGGLRAGDRCAFLSHNTIAYVYASL